jgi:hypothetical protein
VGSWSIVFLGLFWLWAVVAVSLQGVIAAPGLGVWLAWSLVVMIGSVRGRTA